MKKSEKWIVWLIFAVIISAPLIVQAIWSNFVISFGVVAFILIVLLIVLMVPEDKED